MVFHFGRICSTFPSSGRFDFCYPPFPYQLFENRIFIFILLNTSWQPRVLGHFGFTMKHSMTTNCFAESRFTVLCLLEILVRMTFFLDAGYVYTRPQREEVDLSSGLSPHYHCGPGLVLAWRIVFSSLVWRYMRIFLHCSTSMWYYEHFDLGDLAST